MKRKAVSLIFGTLCALCALIAVSLFAGIIGMIIKRGWGTVSWDFLTQPVSGAGASGGILYHLIGTGILLLTALLVSAPLALGLALMQSVYLAQTRWGGTLRLFLYLLNGVPSIVFGIMGMIVFVQGLGWGKSWLTGGFLLGLMILPTVTVSLSERMRALPSSYLEAAAGLGLRRAQIIRAVVLPQSLSGLVTGSLLGLARAAGETAPIMFTATIFSGATVPPGIKESPVLSLPYHIFILAQDSFNPAAIGQLWGTALALLAVVLTLSALALPARLTLHEEARS
jgi:phosphate transport system permease protein